jgi:hypothetical protein
MPWSRTFRVKFGGGGWAGRPDGFALRWSITEAQELAEQSGGPLRIELLAVLGDPTGRPLTPHLSVELRDDRLRRHAAPRWSR